MTYYDYITNLIQNRIRFDERKRLVQAGILQSGVFEKYEIYSFYLKQYAQNKKTCRKNTVANFKTLTDAQLGKIIAEMKRELPFDIQQDDNAADAPQTAANAVIYPVSQWLNATLYDRWGGVICCQSVSYTIV